MCQGVLPSRRHIEKREDPGDEVGFKLLLLDTRAKLEIKWRIVFFKLHTWPSIAKTSPTGLRRKP